jgi:hypothetical protein
VADEPLGAAAVAPQLRAREKEDTPVGEERPAETRGDLLLVRVQVRQPRLGGARVVGPVDEPALDEATVAVERRQEAGGGIVPPVKKRRAIQLESYAYANSRWQKRWTNRRPSSSSVPAMRAINRVVVADVLEHLDGHDAVEMAFEHEPVHVGGDHLDVRDARAVVERPRLDDARIPLHMREKSETYANASAAVQGTSIVLL